MKKISEIKPIIFEELEKLKPNLKLFEVIGNGLEVDSMYVYAYGERYTADNLDSALIAKYMSYLYADSWNSAYYLFTNTEQILPDLGYQVKKTVTKNYRYTDTIKDTDSLPAFDSPNLQTDTQSDRKLIHDEFFENNNRNETVTVGENRDIDRFKKSYDFLLLNWVHDIIFNDLNRYITIYIHS